MSKNKAHPNVKTLKKLSKGELIGIILEQQKENPDPGYTKNFKPALDKVEALFTRLESSEVLGWEHGDVEGFIKKDGNEVLRLCLQGHLNLRAQMEKKRTEVQGADGAIRTYCREDCTRRLMSCFGETIVTRKGYYAKGHNSLFPLDAELNLPPDTYSQGLRERIAAETPKNSFDEAAESIEKTTGGKVPKRQVEEITVEISQDFNDFYAQAKSDEPEDTWDPLILTSDAKGIVMRQDDLREATRKAAEKPGRSKKRLGAGEKKNRKRMAMVGSVYSIEPYRRTAEQIMGLEEEVGKRPRARNKRVWASVAEDAEVVIDEIFQEALRQDPEKRRSWVFLVDGHEDQLRVVRRKAKHYQVEVTIVLDFIHMLEYLWKAAYCFFAAGTQEAEDWVTKYALQVLKGNVSNMAAGMRRKATRLELSQDARKAVDKCASYLLKYKDLLRFNKYLEQGYPIATGVIEGACRHLIGDRMDITGARWRLQRAEAILKLRSLKICGDIDAYWEFYKAQSKQRNYACQYSESTIPIAA